MAILSVQQKDAKRVFISLCFNQKTFDMKTLRDTYPRVSMWYKIKELFEEEKRLSVYSGEDRVVPSKELQEELS